MDVLRGRACATEEDQEPRVVGNVRRGTPVQYVILLAALLVGVTASAKDNFTAAAKHVVTQDLKDPESAKFRNLRTVKTDTGLRILCGEMNAKNSYGAYTGYVPFVSSIDGFSAVGSDESSAGAIRQLYGKKCGF